MIVFRNFIKITQIFLFTACTAALFLSINVAVTSGGSSAKAAAASKGTYIWVPNEASALFDRFGKIGIPAQILKINGGLARTDGRWVFTPLKSSIQGLANKIRASGDEGAWVGKGRQWVYVFGKHQTYMSLTGKSGGRQKTAMSGMSGMKGMKGMSGMSSMSGMAASKSSPRWMTKRERKVAGGKKVWVPLGSRGGGRWRYVPDELESDASKALFAALLRTSPKGTRMIMHNGRWALDWPEVKSATAMAGMSGMKGMSGMGSMSGMASSKSSPRWMTRRERKVAGGKKVWVPLGSRGGGRWRFVPDELESDASKALFAALLRTSPKGTRMIMHNGRWALDWPEVKSATAMSGKSGMKGMSGMSSMSGMAASKSSPRWMTKRERKVAGGKKVWVPSGNRGGGRWRYVPDGSSDDASKSRIAALLRSAPKGSRVVMRNGRWVFEWPQVKSAKKMASSTKKSGVQKDSKRRKKGPQYKDGKAVRSASLADDKTGRLDVRRKKKTVRGLGNSILFFVPGRTPSSGTWFVAPAHILENAKKVSNPAYVTQR